MTVTRSQRMWLLLGTLGAVLVVGFYWLDPHDLLILLTELPLVFLGLFLWWIIPMWWQETRNAFRYGEPAQRQLNVFLGISIALFIVIVLYVLFGGKLLPDWQLYIYG